MAAVTEVEQVSLYPPYSSLEDPRNRYIETEKPKFDIKPHPLVLSNTIQVISEEGLGNAQDGVQAGIKSIYEILAKEYYTHGLPVLEWSDGKRIYEEGTVEEKDKIHIPVMAINPVFLGKLPEGAQAALQAENFKDFKKGMREHLPEGFLFAKTIGSDQMDLGLHKNFANLIFIEDQDSSIRNMDHDRMLSFTRFMMAKIGAFKNIIVPYERHGDEIVFDKVILSTLEGGYPQLDSIRELAHRLMVLGSAKEVGGWRIKEGVTIKNKDWSSSAVVRVIQKLGRFLGHQNLLAAPIKVEELTKSPALARMMSSLLNWTRQAEGAFWAVDPEMPVDDTQLSKDYPWPIQIKIALPIVTCSGRSGAIKTKLSLEDMVGTIPTADGQVEVVGREGQTEDNIKDHQPSVEAEEFTLPLRDLPQIYLGEYRYGYIHSENNSGLVVPALRAGIHLHRGFVEPVSDKIGVVHLDPEKYMPVGCGVDSMHAMSKAAMEQAVMLWEESGRKLQAIVFYVPNHGTNILLPWTADENGVIPKDPYALFKNLVENGELVFTTEVPQV